MYMFKYIYDVSKRIFYVNTVPRSQQTIRSYNVMDDLSKSIKYVKIIVLIYLFVFLLTIQALNEQVFFRLNQVPKHSYKNF